MSAPAGWYPSAIVNRAPSDAGSHLGDVTVGVLHTTESTRFVPSSTSYFGHQSYPHFTVWEGKVWQHISIQRCAKALKNLSGGVETNREGVVQIEVVASAKDPGWSAETTRTVAALMRWIESNTKIPRRSTVQWVSYPASYGTSAGQRLTFAKWREYAGWLGHQHVPENSHGDPGAINITALLGTTEDDMPLTRDDAKLVAQEVWATSVDYGKLYGVGPARADQALAYGAHQAVAARAEAVACRAALAELAKALPNVDEGKVLATVEAAVQKALGSVEFTLSTTPKEPTA